MFDLPVFHTTTNPPRRRRRLAGAGQKPGVELLERRELLDAGLAAGLTSAAASRLLGSLYNDLLNRAPQPTELAAWQNAVTSGQNLQNVAQAFLSSPEYQADFITDTYTTLLKRQPQAQEVNGWLQATQAGLSEEGVTSQFLASEEYYQGHGGTSEGWLTGLYWDLFQRTPDAAGFFLWRNELQSGMSRETIASGFVTSSEANTRFVTASYQQFLGRTPDAAGEASWVAALDAGLSRTQLSAALLGSAEYALTHSASTSALPSNPAANGSPAEFAFGPAWSSAAPGSTEVALVPYSSQTGYGWDSVLGLVEQDGGGITGSDNSFRVDLPNGTYTVTPTFGDTTVAHNNMAVWAQGVQEVAGLNTAAGQFIRPSFNVQVTDGQLVLRFTAEGASNTFALNELDLVPTPASSASTATSPTMNDGTSVASSGTTDTTASADTSGGVVSESASSSLTQTAGGSASLTPSSSGISANLAAINLNFKPHPVTVTINGAPTTSSVNLPIAVTSTVSDPNPGAATAGFKYQWAVIFNNMHVATAATPNFTFTPKTAGTYSLRLAVTDQYNLVGREILSITVGNGAPIGNGVLTVTPSSLPNGTANSAYSATLTATGGSGSYTFAVTSGSLPSGLSLNANTGVVSGMPVTPGSSTFTITAADSKTTGLTGSHAYTLSINSPGGVSSGPLSVSINGAPASSPEGAPIALTSTVTSSSAADMAAGFSYSWNVTKDGAAFTTATTPNFNLKPTDRGTYVITLTATAQDQTTGTASQTITVSDVAPLVSISGAPASSPPGTILALASNVFSPSMADTAAGFRYAWSVTSNNAVVASGTAANFSFTPASAGTYVVALTATDTGGAAGTASKTISVATKSTPPPPPPPGSFITTPYDKIPNFGANPTVVSAASGAWSSPSTWSGGRVPGAGDVVSINANTTVTYDVVSDAAVNTVIVQSGGELTFRTDVTTRLTVVNLIVLEGGTLQIGTASNPVSPSVKAEVVIADQAIDTAVDPAQYGNGLIGLGTVTMYGAAKTQTFVKLATEPKAGDTTLTLSQAVTGWQVGDKVLLPDSRQLIRGNQTDGNYVSEIETPSIASISSDGLTVTLSSPLQYSHPGARDGKGVLDFLPYVGNLSRNVMIHSSSNTGTRGHILFTYHANVDVEYAGFYGLGRTREAALDNTTFDSSGNVTHVGTNEDGRYPVYFDHVIGSGLQSDGHLYTMQGDVVFCTMEPQIFRWGIAIKDSSYGLIQDNVVDNWDGAGIITVTGNESYNVINHNYVGDIMGPEGEAQLAWIRADSGAGLGIGYEGVGYWFRGFNNYVTNNVAADCGSYGYTYFAQYIGSVNIPLAPGDDTSTAGQYQTMAGNAMPILQFSGNEAFGATCSGMTIWWLATIWHTPQDQTPTSVIKDFHVWNVDNQGFFAYEMNKVTFDGFVVRGDFGLLAQGQGYGALEGFGANDYFVKDMVIENSDIQGMWEGFNPSTDSGGGSQTIQNSYLDNYYNVYLQHLWTSSYRSDQIPPRVTYVRDCTFATPNVPDLSTGPKENIYMDDSVNSDVFNLIAPDQLFVYDYNGVAGDDFQAYFLDQSPTAVVRQSTYNSDGTPRLDASPQAGLTNQQLWALNGTAMAGAVAPTTTMAGVHGYVRAF